MQKLVAELTGSIGNQDTDTVSESDVMYINANFELPVTVTANDIYVRECWLGGDAINSKMGRFRTKDLNKLLKLTNGAPLMEMHKTGGMFGDGPKELPIGRFFSGKVKSKEIDHLDGSRGPASFIVPKFYWMKNNSGAEDLRVNIDGGIFNEASLGFTFAKPSCSICEEDIRMCKHVPGEKYRKEFCHYFCDKPLAVLEGSIVHRGAHPGTQFETNMLSGTVIDKRIIRVKYEGKIIKLGYMNG